VTTQAWQVARDHSTMMMMKMKMLLLLLLLLLMVLSDDQCRSQ